MIYADHPALIFPKSNDCFLSWTGEKVSKAMFTAYK